MINLICRYVKLQKLQICVCSLCFMYIVTILGMLACLTRSSGDSVDTLHKETCDTIIETGDATKLERGISLPIDDNTIIVTSHIATKRHYCLPIKHRFFPFCTEKFNHFKYVWKGDKCLENKFKIDGSLCSIYHYLTNVEPFCAGAKEQYKATRKEYATPRFDLNGLLKLLGEDSLKWLRQRVNSTWIFWQNAGKTFLKDRPRYKRKNVIVYLGVLGYEPFILRSAFTGGFLGELIQWTDLIAGLYMLGYNITIAKHAQNLSTFIVGNDATKCAGVGEYKDKVDIIYTDIIGVMLFEQAYGTSSTGKYKCMLRVLDSFGTDPEYNVNNYPHELPGGRSVYGNLNLLLSQFLTLYPHTQDNRFMGFAISSNKNISLPMKPKKDIALLYAKHSKYFLHKERYLQIISEYFEIQATCVDDGNVPSYIINHGPVNPSKVQSILSSAKLFIGVGFPYEGPGPLEAMASGTVFLQPKFDIPVGKLNDVFFERKPTRRELTSQNPYMEEYVNEPYCYTINITDETILRKTLLKIKKMKPLPGKIPKEFTHEGMIERIFAFTSHLDHCNPYAPRWPPLDNLQIYFSLRGASCKDTCMSKGLVCERTYFSDINSVYFIERYGKVKCKQIITVDYSHSPSFDPVMSVCYKQRDVQLFNCMNRDDNVQRLCPCRDYEFEQTAICKNCL